MITLILPIELEPSDVIPVFDLLRNLNDDEFYAFCQVNSDHKFERTANGDLLLVAPTGGQTGLWNSSLTCEVAMWNRQGKPGYTFDSSTGFRLPNGAVRGPDVAWITAERYNALTPDQRRKFPPLCPDFLVELVSETDSQKNTETKMAEYMANGCRLGWLINPKTQTAKVYRENGSIDVITNFDGALSGEDVLPGFALPLALFR